MKLTALCAAAFLCTTACKKDGADEPGASRGPSDALEGLLAKVPGDASAVFYLDSPKPFWEVVTGGFIGTTATWEKYKGGLQEELSAYLNERIGVDLRPATAIVVFIGDPKKKEFTLIAGGVEGSLKGDEKDGMKVIEVDRADDKKIIAAQKGSTLAIGEANTVAKTLARKGDLSGRPKALFDATRGSYAAFQADLATLGPIFNIAPPVPGIEGIEGHYGPGGLVVAISGKSDALDSVQAMIKQALELSVAETAKAKATMKERSTLEGAGAIWAHHGAQYLADELRPERKGDKLVIDYPLKTTADASIIVATVGVLAAVAIPAFMKYIKKSKTSEARQFVKKIYDGARAYYMDRNGRTMGGEAEPPRFPASTGITPPLGSCCKQGGKCMPDAQLWNKAPWIELMFSVDDPHYYSYEFENVSRGDKQAFYARAFGDLDCDGIYSTFEMYGEVNSEYADGPAGTAAIYRENELE